MLQTKVKPDLSITAASGLLASSKAEHAELETKLVNIA
jgi:hypothetical protein